MQGKSFSKMGHKKTINGSDIDRYAFGCVGSLNMNNNHARQQKR